MMGEDASSIEGHISLLKSEAAKGAISNPEALALAMQVTESMRNSMLHSLPDLMEKFPILSIEGMVRSFFLILMLKI